LINSSWDRAIGSLLPQTAEIFDRLQISKQCVLNGWFGRSGKPFANKTRHATFNRIADSIANSPRCRAGGLI
jgi:hypothetical protein